MRIKSLKRLKMWNNNRPKKFVLKSERINENRRKRKQGHRYSWSWTLSPMKCAHRLNAFVILKRKPFWSLWNKNTAHIFCVLSICKSKTNGNLKLLKQQEVSAWNNDDTESPFSSQEHKGEPSKRLKKTGRSWLKYISNHNHIRMRDYVSSSMISFVHYIFALNSIMRRLNVQHGHQIHFFPSFVNDTSSSIIVVNNMSPSVFT